jgi:hypothetical protein
MPRSNLWRGDNACSTRVWLESAPGHTRIGALTIHQCRPLMYHTPARFAHQLLPGLSDYPLLWEDGLGRVGLQSLARLSRAVSAATRPVRDFGQQIERTQNGLAQGFSVSKDRLSRRSARWLCTRALIVGTGDFGFSTVHRLFNGESAFIITQTCISFSFASCAPS